MKTSPSQAAVFAGLIVIGCGSGGHEGPANIDDDTITTDAGQTGSSTNTVPPDAETPYIGIEASPLATEAGPCSMVLTATVRDFEASHPDFESYAGDNAYPGLVRELLGQDQKPVHAQDGPTAQTSGPAAFAQWYNDVAGVNLPFEVALELTEVRPGVYGFGGPGFFPLDGLGFGDSGQDLAGQNHNFHFTTEVHTEFPYEGGEVFTFRGDDDMWLFVNGKLAIDLGGLHPERTGVLDLDTEASRLSLEVGNTYAMDIFHAERHTEASNFYVETTIGCFHAPVAPK